MAFTPSQKKGSVRLLPVPPACGNCKDGLRIEKAKKRLQRACRRLGSWRKVAENIGINHKYVLDLVNHDIVPSTRINRLALGLPAIMPSEKVIKIKQPLPHLGTPEWFPVFLKPIKKPKWIKNHG